MSKNRVVYMDVLRILATVAIVIVHVCAQDWSAAPLDSTRWLVYNVGDSVCRWGVPAFLMISGALFLNPEKELNIKKLYTKNITRMVTAFAFWAIVYTVYAVMGNKYNWEQIATMLIKGKGHMWFIILIIAMYIAVPVLRSVTKDEKLMRYFLISSFMLTVVAQTVLISIVPLIDNSKVKLILNLLKADYQEMGIGSIIGYSFYFVLGYYLSSREQKRIEKILAYVGALVGFVATIILTHIASEKLGNKHMGFYGNMTLNVFLQCVGMFVIVKNIKWNLGKILTKCLQTVSSWCFGIYLVHELLILILGRVGISVWAFHPVISVPLVAGSVFVVGLVISAILHQIPVLKKYIV